jgi:hypothetical protein
MKKIIFILSVLFCLNASAQSVTIPVTRISLAPDSSLFNFRPYTLFLSVQGGATIGNTNFHYEILDSIAAYTPHLTPFGTPFSRSASIIGQVTLPTNFFMSAFDKNNQPIIPVFNQLLGFMDMQCDTTRQFIIK